MHRILITGASGFIGSSLTAHLKASNYYVVGLTRNKKRAQLNKESRVDDWVECNLNDPNLELDKILKNIDYVIHLAANAHQTKKIPYETYYAVNTVTTELLVKAAAKASVKKFVYLSTIKVNGDITEPGSDTAFTENSDASPSDYYGLSKQEAENRIIQTCESSDMSYVILRPPLVYGAGVKANFLSLMRIISMNFPLPMASIINRRSLIYVGNLSELIEKCLRHDKASNQLYVLKDITISLPDLIRCLSKALNSHTYLLPCPPKLLMFLSALLGKRSVINKLVTSLEIDDEKIRRDLEWEPGISFEESIAVTVRWFIERASVAGK
jgi:UDP-N-acetyl-alpha-D-quinovosamine dehydrogenase